MKYFAGIDPSFAGTAIVILNEDYTLVEEIKFTTKKEKDKSTEEKMIYMSHVIKEFISKYGKDEIMFNIEDIAFGATGQGSAQQAALNYAIRALLFEMGYKYTSVPPSSVKKHISGNGNAKKELMLKEVYKRWNIDYDDNDLCDAYCIARYLIDKYKTK